MADAPNLIVCGTAPRPDMPSRAECPDACPECGCEEFESGFGLAGGGYGGYIACGGCGAVVAKDQEDG